MPSIPLVWKIFARDGATHLSFLPARAYPKALTFRELARLGSGMNTPLRPVTRSTFIPLLLAAATLTAPAQACINGKEFHPERRPFEAPKPPSKQLIADVPLLQPDAPVVVPPLVLTLPGLTPTAPASEATALAPFSLYVAEFEKSRMSPLNRSFARRIDYTVALIRLGRAAEAIVELEAIERAFPGQYATAANLGTAYELEGRLADALTWITRGIERNPDSHFGTEWLHVAILKAKLKLKDDPAWLAQHSVLDEAGPRSAGEIVLAIEYQLNERLVFVQPEDPVVCDLFYQAASRLDATQPGMAERRTGYLQSSLRFGAWRKAEVERALKG